MHQLFEFWVRLRPARVTLGVRGLVVDHKGRVCLVRHTYRDGWFLPGGGVKTREALVEAVARELREETGVVVAETAPKNVLGVYSSRHGNRKRPHRRIRGDRLACRGVGLARDRRGGLLPPRRTATRHHTRHLTPHLRMDDRSPPRPPLVIH